MHGQSPIQILEGTVPAVPLSLRPWRHGNREGDREKSRNETERSSRGTEWCTGNCMACLCMLGLLLVAYFLQQFSCIRCFYI